MDTEWFITKPWSCSIIHPILSTIPSPYHTHTFIYTNNHLSISTPYVQLFEPMGKPINRHGGLGFRDVPRCVIQWLDTCSPLDNGNSWGSVGMSAITNQQQYTPFDCGVACLLYAEKCGQGHASTEINEGTTQGNISEYRKVIQDFVTAVNTMEDYDMDWGE